MYKVWMDTADKRKGEENDTEGQEQRVEWTSGRPLKEVLERSVKEKHGNKGAKGARCRR